MITPGAHKKWLTNGPAPAQLLLSLIAFCWLAAKLIGWKVWVTERTFPVIAPFDFLYHTPSVVHWVLLVLSIILLLLLVIRPGNIYVQRTLLFSEIASCSLDETRWQPWEYLYLFILVVFIINRAKKQQIGFALLITLSVVYIYSGLQKFNGGFVTSMWQNTILRRFFRVSPGILQARWVHFIGYLLPLAETIAGIGLLFSATRKKAVILLIGMHVFILLLIGPLGLHYNKIVWPWNAAMIILLYLLLIQNKESPTRFVELQYSTKVLLIAWSFLPALNCIGYWDNYLSWRLYSANAPSMVICIKDTSVTTPLRAFYNSSVNQKICNGNAMLNVQRWALNEMNVPPYPEERVYKIIENRWNKTYPSSDASFVIYYFPFKKSN